MHATMNHPKRIALTLLTGVFLCSAAWSAGASEPPPPPAAVGAGEAATVPDGPLDVLCPARVTNAWGLSAVTVGTQFNQVQYLLQPGDTATVVVPGPATMCIWECLSNGSGWDCRWDCSYTICPNGLYRVTQQGPTYDLTSTTIAAGTCSSCSVVETRRRSWGQLKSHYR